MYEPSLDDVSKDLRAAEKRDGTERKSTKSCPPLNDRVLTKDVIQYADMMSKTRLICR